MHHARFLLDEPNLALVTVIFKTTFKISNLFDFFFFEKKTVFTLETLTPECNHTSNGNR